jgi:hypothetical protein
MARFRFSLTASAYTKTWSCVEPNRDAPAQRAMRDSENICTASKYIIEHYKDHGLVGKCDASKKKVETARKALNSCLAKYTGIKGP